MIDKFLHRINQVKDSEELNNIRIEALGKKGVLAEAVNKMKLAKPEEKPKIGKEINELKAKIQEAIEVKKKELEEIQLNKYLKNSIIDTTLPTRKTGSQIRGRKHIITETIEQIYNICKVLGCKIIDGPEMEDEWHNFDALNMSEDHPARQLHDTFYIEKYSPDRGISEPQGEKSAITNHAHPPHMLLRTHTSSMQIRHMARNAAPQRIASIGKVYRADYDATHTPMFHQVEILSISENASMSELKMCISNLLSMYFGVDNIKMRFRSSYFPFTEPSMEIDIMVIKEEGGQRIAKKEDAEENGKWLEILGAGMVHRNVLNNMKVAEGFFGFALGMGIERIAMLKHGIKDLRYFYDKEYQGAPML